MGSDAVTGFDQGHPPDNQTAYADGLPEARPVPHEQLDRRALKAWRISGLLSSLVVFCLAAAISTLFSYLDLDWWLVVLPLVFALIVGIIAVWIIPPIQWRHWRYAVTERDIELQHGIIIVTRTLIPIVRVQHVDTRQGPILRQYGLAGIAIATAAGTQEIPALAMHVADNLRNRISDLAGIADDV